MVYNIIAKTAPHPKKSSIETNLQNVFFLKKMQIDEFVHLKMLTQKQGLVWLKLVTISHFFLPTKLTGRQVQMLPNLTSQLTLIGIVVGSLIRKQRAEWLNGFRELE